MCYTCILTKQAHLWVIFMFTFGCILYWHNRKEHSQFYDREVHVIFTLEWVLTMLHIVCVPEFENTPTAGCKRRLSGHKKYLHTHSRTAERFLKMMLNPINQSVAVAVHKSWPYSACFDTMITLKWDLRENLQLLKAYGSLFNFSKSNKFSQNASSELCV